MTYVITNTKWSKWTTVCSSCHINFTFHIAHCSLSILYQYTQLNILKQYTLNIIQSRCVHACVRLHKHMYFFSANTYVQPTRMCTFACAHKNFHLHNIYLFDANTIRTDMKLITKVGLLSHWAETKCHSSTKVTPSDIMMQCIWVSKSYHTLRRHQKRSSKSSGIWYLSNTSGNH